MNYEDISWSEAREKMTKSAISSLEKEGYKLSRIPGRGRASNWTYTFGDETGRLAIRTSNDRWFAFMREGDEWKTLKDCDKVVVVTVDNPDDPNKFEVYLFSANDVSNSFNASRDARLDAGMTVREGYGMWIGIDAYEESSPLYVGSGLGKTWPPISISPIFSEEELDIPELPRPPASSQNIDTILKRTRNEISIFTGIPEEKISLELRLDY